MLSTGVAILRFQVCVCVDLLILCAQCSMCTCRVCDSPTLQSCICIGSWLLLQSTKSGRPGMHSSGFHTAKHVALCQTAGCNSNPRNQSTRVTLKTLVQTQMIPTSEDMPSNKRKPSLTSTHTRAPLYIRTQNRPSPMVAETMENCLDQGSKLQDHKLACTMAACMHLACTGHASSTEMNDVHPSVQCHTARDLVHPCLLVHCPTSRLLLPYWSDSHARCLV